MAGESNNGNGYIRWREHQQMQEAHEARVTDMLRRAHDYHEGVANKQDARFEPLEKRVDAVESVIDQQRGARTLVYFLIGSNLMLVASVIVAVIVAFI